MFRARNSNVNDPTALNMAPLDRRNGLRRPGRNDLYGNFVGSLLSFFVLFGPFFGPFFFLLG